MPDTLDVALDAATVRRWCDGSLVALQAHQQEIDDLNVYPVPDGDTGTNLVLTLSSARAALTGDGAGVGATLGGALALLSRGALLGARGNSGVIVAQILRGLAAGLTDDERPGPVPVTAAPAAADGHPVAAAPGRVAARPGGVAADLPPRGHVDGPRLARALRMAADAAWAAVAAPVEGTVLSVASAAAEAATATARTARPGDLEAVARSAAQAAAVALARTPSQLPQLAAAGVIDAGGRGLCLLLDALVEALTAGACSPDAPVDTAPPTGPLTTVPHAHDEAASAFAYEVQYLLDADVAAVERLKAELAGFGDSLVVVGDPPTWNVHVHVDDVGRAVEAGVEAGRPYRISVTRFADQAGPRRVDEHRRAVVVMADGDGLARVFAGEGAAVVGTNPSTAEVVAALRATGAARVVLLPDDRNRHAVAASAAQEAAAHGVRVSVVPTRSPVQALAALAVRDAERAFSQDVIAMAEAAGACRYGEVCLATREALTVAGRCLPGDVLGLVEGEVHLIGDDLAQVCQDLLDRMLGGGGELVTLLFGADAPAGLPATLRAHLARRWPFAEINEFAGGQPRFPLLVGVE